MTNISKAELMMLVPLAREGDREAFAKLYDATVHSQFFIAISILKNRDSAEDAVQNAYLKAMERICSLENPSSFHTWLGRITYNCCIDRIRDGSKLNEKAPDEELFQIPDDCPDRNPLAQTLRTEKKTVLLRCINELSPLLKEVIIYRYYHQLKLKELSEVLDCSIGTVKSRLHNAQRELRGQLMQTGYSGLHVSVFFPFLLSDTLSEAASMPHVSSTVSKRQLCFLTTAGLLAFLGAFILSQSHSQNAGQDKSNFDFSPPQVLSCQYRNYLLELRLFDEQSGIDWDNCYIMTRDGRRIRPVQSLPDKGLLHFPVSEAELMTAKIYDKAGNQASYSIQLSDYDYYSENN